MSSRTSCRARTQGAQECWGWDRHRQAATSPVTPALQLHLVEYPQEAQWGGGRSPAQGRFGTLCQLLLFPSHPSSAGTTGSGNKKQPMAALQTAPRMQAVTAPRWQPLLHELFAGLPQQLTTLQPAPSPQGLLLPPTLGEEQMPGSLTQIRAPADQIRAPALHLTPHLHHWHTGGPCGLHTWKLCFSSATIQNLSHLPTPPKLCIQPSCHRYCNPPPPLQPLLVRTPIPTTSEAPVVSLPLSCLLGLGDSETGLHPLTSACS